MNFNKFQFQTAVNLVRKLLWQAKIQEPLFSIVSVAALKALKAFLKEDHYVANKLMKGNLLG